MIIIYDGVSGIYDLKLQLAKHFEMEYLGTLRYFLGIEVVSSPRGYILFQCKYVANILEQIHLSHTREANSPLELNVEYVVLATVYTLRLLYLILLVLFILLVSLLSFPLQYIRKLFFTFFDIFRGIYFLSFLFPSSSSFNLSAYFDID